ncbi:hypothetical protein B0J18DRAFT_304419 [Chaetomium sp. MPI-SDFR-AT-0129]|nr:hypothetical protein B0J18DRAFT_304419 [Chaetomium sp. MPI-SDFR-AT-0129]
MAQTRAQMVAQRALLSPASNYQGNQPPPRKGSSRKRATGRAERNRLCPTTPSSQDPPAPVQSRGRKCKQPIEHALEDTDRDPDPKRRRTSPPHTTEDAFGEPAIGSSASKHTDPVAFWVKENRWPEEQNWPEETSTTDFTMDRLLARRKSSSNLSRKRSNSGTSTTPSDQKPQEEKSAPYRHQRYKTVLELRGSYMTKAPLGLDRTSQALCRSLLEKTPSVPSDTLFRDDVFETTCQKIHNKNEECPAPMCDVHSTRADIGKYNCLIMPRPAPVSMEAGRALVPDGALLDPSSATLIRRPRRSCPPSAASYLLPASISRERFLLPHSTKCVALRESWTSAAIGAKKAR